MDALKSDHSPFVVHKASLDCRGGRRSKLDLSHAFCRDFRTEVHISYFCRVRSMVAGDLGSAGHLQVLLEWD